jgi:hypothetical protein
LELNSPIHSNSIYDWALAIKETTRRFARKGAKWEELNI